jgi:hypothetical protein
MYNNNGLLFTPLRHRVKNVSEEVSGKLDGKKLKVYTISYTLQTCFRRVWRYGQEIRDLLKPKIPILPPFDTFLGFFHSCLAS